MTVSSKENLGKNERTWYKVSARKVVVTAGQGWWPVAGRLVSTIFRPTRSEGGILSGRHSDDQVRECLLKKCKV